MVGGKYNSSIRTFLKEKYIGVKNEYLESSVSTLFDTSIKVYLGDILRFINTSNIGDHKDLLLYERGKAKLRFNIAKAKIEVEYINIETFKKDYTIREINMNFKNIIDQFEKIKDAFLLSVENDEFYKGWITSIRKEIKL